MLTFLTTLFTNTQQQIPQAIHYKERYVIVNIQAARRYRIYPTLFSILDEGGA